MHCPCVWKAVHNRTFWIILVVYVPQVVYSTCAYLIVRNQEIPINFELKFNIRYSSIVQYFLFNIFCYIYASISHKRGTFLDLLLPVLDLILTRSVRKLHTLNKTIGTFFPVKFLSRFSPFFTLRAKTTPKEK